jgi:tetratricopeptide (TPR) repeat protein
MRFLTPFVVLPLVFLLASANTTVAAQRDQVISGRLIFDNGEFSCDRCIVSLLANGIRPVAVAYADLSGHFMFTGVPRGVYTIHVELDGFQDVNQNIETGEGEANILVTLLRKPAVQSTGAQIVNISEFKELYPRKAVSNFEKGIDELKKNKTDQAIQYFRQAVELAPTFYEAHNQLGIAYRDAGRTDDAEREFLKAHELNSTGIGPLLNLTSLYLAENKPDRAVKTGEEAVKANSHSAPAFFNLGVALYKAAMPDKAEVALKRALELAPRMANVRLMLANVYLKLHRYDKTMEQLDNYIAENPHGDHLTEVQQMRDQLMGAGVCRTVHGILCLYGQ